MLCEVKLNISQFLSTIFINSNGMLRPCNIVSGSPQHSLAMILTVREKRYEIIVLLPNKRPYYTQNAQNTMSLVHSECNKTKISEYFNHLKTL